MGRRGGVSFVHAHWDPPLAAVHARLPTPPTVELCDRRMADGNWLAAEELGPGPACGSVLRCFQRSSCTCGTTSSESSESRLCDGRTGSASPACDGHTKGRVAHPPADTLRTVSQAPCRQTPAVPGATCPPSILRPSALRPHDAPGRQHAPIDTVTVPGNSGGYLCWIPANPYLPPRFFFSPTPTNRTDHLSPARQAKRRAPSSLSHRPASQSAGAGPAPAWPLCWL